MEESTLGDFLKGITPQKSAKLRRWKSEYVKRGWSNRGVEKGWVKLVLKGRVDWTRKNLTEIPPSPVRMGLGFRCYLSPSAKTTSWSRRCIILLSSGGDDRQWQSKIRTVNFKRLERNNEAQIRNDEYIDRILRWMEISLDYRIVQYRWIFVEL